jgi:hypothetical protein
LRAGPRSVLRLALFGDLDGTLDVLRIECTRCKHVGRYHIPYC